MKKFILIGIGAFCCLVGMEHPALAQGAVVDGGSYKMTHYGVVADGSATAFGVAAGTPLCLDVASNLSTAGTAIGQWGDNGIDAQRFVFELQTDGSYKLRHKGTTMYVQPVGLSKLANTRIEQNVLLTSGDDAQRWFITDPNGNGRYKFTLKNSVVGTGPAQVLEVGFGSAAPGAPVNLFDDNGFEPAQRWQLARVVLATKNAADAALWVQSYPNPMVQGQRWNLRVEAQHNGSATVAVLDAMGRIAHRETVDLRTGGNALTLAAAALAPGLYLVRVQQGLLVQQTPVVQQ